MSWNVLHVRPRTEKKMAEYTRVLGAEFYLPLRSETKIYQYRKVTVEKPVFPGYFFASFEPEDRASLLKSNLVVRVLEADNETRLIHELDQVRKALAVDPTLGSCSAIKQGCRVMIRGGAFMGIEGVVTSLKGSGKVCLNIDMIGRAVAVEVARELLEPVD